jgi:hypothetical protein
MGRKRERGWQQERIGSLSMDEEEGPFIAGDDHPAPYPAADGELPRASSSQSPEGNGTRKDVFTPRGHRGTPGLWQRNRGCVWFEPELAQPKFWHDQNEGMTKILVSCYCLVCSHCNRQNFGKIAMSPLGLEPTELKLEHL